METIKKWKCGAGLVVCAALLLAGCAGMGGMSDIDQQTAEVLRSSFRAQGIVSLDVLDTDETNRLCSAAADQGGALDEATARRIEAFNFNTIKAPPNGKYIGDWRAGEALAQSGRGLTFTDSKDTPNGGNCYNCHQIDKKEIAFGTIGPSLYNYGKLRAVRDPASAESLPIVQYTWGKIWNAKGSNACSNMPRFGHKALFTPAQIADLMALLLDPKSPVNQ